MKSGQSLDRAVNVVVAIAALLVIWRLLPTSVTTRGGDAARDSAASRILPDSVWGRVLAAARFTQTAPATDTIVMFTDFECPYCANMDRELHALQGDLGPTRIALAFVHFPLRPIHRFAVPAAHAVECAGQQGRLDELARAVYDAQDSLGLIAWRDLAARIGVPDLAGFATCMSQSVPSEVANGESLAKELGLTGTPAVALRRRLFDLPPTTDAIRQVLAVDAETARVVE